jgi:hypothetical protein
MMMLSRTRVFAILYLLSSPVSAVDGISACTDKDGHKLFTDNTTDCLNPIAPHTNIDNVTPTMNRENKYYIDQIPDLPQIDAVDYFNNGKRFCGPISVANSLSWLEGRTERSQQVALVKKLASKDYMNTVGKNGTNAFRLISGIKRHLADIGVLARRLEYRGWSKAPPNHSVGTRVDLQWVADGIDMRSAVWINIGWYKFDNIGNRFVRNGGHWLTLVGYELGNEKFLSLHDSSTDAADTNDRIRISPLEMNKKLVNGKTYETSSNGFYYLDYGLRKPNQVDRAIIDGAVLLQI